MILTDIRRCLHQAIGQYIEITTKKSTICGTLVWLSPDHSMAEIQLEDGQIITVTDVQIKNIRHYS